MSGTALAQLLDGRQRRLGRHERWNSVLASLVAHALLIVGALVVPRFLEEPPEPFEPLSVTIVPPSALGVEQPIEATPEPTPVETPPPAPPPEAPPPEPTPVDVPPPSDRPQLVREPEPQPEPQPEPAPKPAPRVEQPPAPTPPPPREATPPPPRTANPMARRAGSPFGNPLGSSQNAAVQGVEDPDFTYGYYLDRVVAAISQTWRRPPVGGEIVQASFYFRIQADGRVTDIELTATSGDDSFDRAARRAVEAASPLPPLPRSYKKDSLGLNLIVK